MNNSTANDKYHAIFRGALCTEIALVALVTVVSLIDMTITAEANAAAMEEMTAIEAASALLMVATLLVNVPLYIASLIGLFQYRWWARWLYVGNLSAGILLSTVASLAMFQFCWVLSTVLSSTASIVTGAIITMMFLTPTSDRFERPRPLPEDGEY